MAVSAYPHTPAALPPRKICRTKWIGGWMSLRAGQHALENRKLFVSVDNRTIFRRLYTLQTGHYIDWAITDHIITTTCIRRLNTRQPTFNTYFTKPTRESYKVFWHTTELLWGILRSVCGFAHINVISCFLPHIFQHFTVNITNDISYSFIYILQCCWHPRNIYRMILRTRKTQNFGVGLTWWIWNQVISPSEKN